MTQVAINDFLKDVIERAREDGYIDAPQSSRSGGRDYIFVPSGGGCTFCCCPGGGGRDDKGAVLVAVALFALSFFVGLFYTTQSARTAVEATQDLKFARDNNLDDAVILLEGWRQERTFAALSQSMMTAGAGFLTVACLIVLLYESQPLTFHLGLTGAALGFTGTALWAVKHGCLLNRAQQAAANRIAAQVLLNF